MKAFALALLAIPFAFGVVRFVTTARDWRYLVVAVASTIGALLMVRGSKVSTTTRLGAALAGAGVLAALAAIAVGARSLISVSVVALGFAVCSVSGAALLGRARRASSGVG